MSQFQPQWTSEDGSSDLSLFAQIGWSDHMAEQPFPLEYDTWREVDQRNYENGRQRAANWLFAGKPHISEHATASSYQEIVKLVGAAFYSSKAREKSIPLMPDSRQGGQRSQVRVLPSLALLGL